MITDGITSANINNSKYLFIIDDNSVDEDDDVDSVGILATFCILNPKINDEVPIKKETIVRTFCVRPGMIVIGKQGLFVVVVVVVVLSQYYCPCMIEIEV
jgi:hypothetical protein